MKLQLLGIVMFLLINSGWSQTDTAFWFVAPEVTYNNGNIHGDRPIYLRFTALNQDANITISQPANAAFTNITLLVVANTSSTIDLTSNIDIIENKPADLVLNYGLLIRSSAFVTAYYEEASVNNPEIFALKGRNALGNSFFIPAQNLMNNTPAFTPTSSSSFDIVATEDNTDVTITPSQNIVGHGAGITFSVTLNKGQTYSATAIGASDVQHLMGSTVTATKPIAITIKDDSIGGGGYAGCLDLAGDQIVPLALVGTKYISLPGYLNNPNSQPTDHVFILATSDNTIVTINGAVVATLNKGQTYRQGSYNEVFYIETTKPVYVLHLSGFGCEVGHALLPQLDCSGSRTVGFTRSVTSPLYVNILVQSGGEGDFTFNGNTSVITAVQFTTVPFSNGAWKYARIQLSANDLAAGNAAIVKNTSTDFHLSIIHGDAASGCRYGYFSGFNKFDAVSFSNITNNNPGCSGDTLKLYCDVGATGGIQFSWVGPNGFTSNLQNPFIPNIQTNNSGTYTITATKPNCNTVVASTSVSIFQKPNINISSNSPLCEGLSLALMANAVLPATTYQWIGPNNYSSTTLTNSLTNTVSSMSGTYILTSSTNGCKDVDSITVVISPKPSALITSTLPSCRFSTLQLSNNNTLTNAIYQWSHANGFNSTMQNVIINNYDYNDTGKYYLTVSANGCTAKDSIIATLKESPIIQFLPVTGICQEKDGIQLLANETSGLLGVGSFSGSGVSTSGFFNPKNANIGSQLIRYNYVATNGCIAFKEQPITVYSTPTVDAGTDKTILQGGSTSLNASVSSSQHMLSWMPTIGLDNPQVLNPIASPAKSQMYQLGVTSVDGCYNVDSVFVRVLQGIKIPNAFSPNGDNINDVWNIDGLSNFSNCELTIFNRYGAKVYESKGYVKPWNGMHKANPLPAGTYYYLIYLNDGFRSQPMAGWLSILR